MTIKIIAAVSKNGVIGRRSTNSIPWDYPEDMKWFRKSTAGQTVIMGRHTYESVGSKPLPKRRNIVITRSKIEGIECFETVEQAISSAKNKASRIDTMLFDSDESREAYEKMHNNVWIIGGEHIYREGLQFADEIFLTLIPEYVDGVAGIACFPWIDPSRFQINDYITLEGERPVSLKVAHYIRY